MVVREGSNVTLRCAARGSPTPVITWRREGNEPLTLPAGGEGNGVRMNLISSPAPPAATDGVPPSLLTPFSRFMSSSCIQ